MMTQRFFLTAVSALLMQQFTPVSAFARSDTPRAPSQPKLEIASEAGLKIPDWGISVDAAYDPRLDDLVEGHKIINILLTNSGEKPITLDPRADKWIIVDSQGHKHTADNHVSFFDRKAWDEMDPALKRKLDYPPYVKPGNSANIDVFFPIGDDLRDFKEIIWRSASIGKEFNIFTSVENSVNVDRDDKNFTLPPSEPQHWNSTMEQKSREEILNPEAYPQAQNPPGSTPGSDRTNVMPNTDRTNTIEPTIVTSAPSPTTGDRTDLDPTLDNLEDMMIIR